MGVLQLLPKRDTEVKTGVKREMITEKWAEVPGKYGNVCLALDPVTGRKPQLPAGWIHCPELTGAEAEAIKKLRGKAYEAVVCFDNIGSARRPRWVARTQGYVVRKEWLTPARLERVKTTLKNQRQKAAAKGRATLKNRRQEAAEATLERLADIQRDYATAIETMGPFDLIGEGVFRLWPNAPAGMAYLDDTVNYPVKVVLLSGEAAHGENVLEAVSKVRRRLHTKYITKKEAISKICDWGTTVLAYEIGARYLDDTLFEEQCGYARCVYSARQAIADEAFRERGVEQFND